MRQRIFILWASWNVWRELVRQIVEKDWKENHVNPSKIVWISSSSKYIFSSWWIEDSVLNDISESRETAVEAFKSKGTQFTSLSALLDIVKKQWMDWEIVFVDVTAWKQDLLDFHKEVILKSNNYLVTANKNPISLFSIEDFNELTSYNWRYDTNTTVMGWAWVLNFVNFRNNWIKDNIKKIEWVFSWTLGYILSELEKWENSFSQIVKNAKEWGYTEPNPWDDLNWLDVARKLVILARYAGHSISIDDVKVSPLIDEKYAEYTWDEFLNKLKDEDAYFDKSSKEASDEWKVLRYVWEMSFNKWKIELKVLLKKVDKNSDLGTLSWTSNLAVIETEILEAPLPHVIKSRWAWLAVTAWSVRVWIFKMLPSNIISK